MALPPIAPFPPAEVRMQMMPEEWDSCLESWSILTKLLLERPDDDFTGIATRDAGLIAFLCSYVHEASRVHGSDGRLDTPHARTLRRHVFLLCHRCLLHVQPIPARLLGWDFLTSFCGTYARSSSLKGLLHHLWQQRRQQLDGTFTKVKGDITERLEMRGKEKARVLEDDLTRLGYLFRTSPDVSRLFMIGSDFLDALSTAFTSSSGTLRRKVVAVTYLGLTSLTEGDHPNFSLLFDHLYTLKSVVESRGSSEHDTLLSDLISNTPFLLHLQDRIHGAEAARAKSLFAYLEGFPKTARARRRMSIRKQGQKGKSPAVGNLTEDGFSHDLYAHIHVHRMSLISQVQDLFPNLGAAFVMKLLDEYGENVEQVIGHLLEDSLPPHLKQADHSKELTPKPHHAHFIPRSTPSPPPSLPTTRRNIHDNDELSTLSVPLSRLQFGRKDGDLTADALLQDRSTAPGKAAILSALAAFDSDDDEHDDTYDAEDDGGVVGSSIDSDVTGPRVHNETGGNSAGHNPRTDADVVLFQAYSRDTTIFARTADIRRGEARRALRTATGLTDEAIEGWAVMIERDPRRLRRLKDRFEGPLSHAGFQQRALAPTAWRGDDGGGDEGEGHGADGSGGGGDQGPIRGRGRGGGSGQARGGGSERGRGLGRGRERGRGGGRANHNRRDQHAKKMARGGGAAA